MLPLWQKNYTIYTVLIYWYTKEDFFMKHIKTINKPYLQSTLKTGGCGECQASCQSACKTSSTVGNQVSEKRK